MLKKSILLALILCFAPTLHALTTCHSIYAEGWWQTPDDTSFSAVHPAYAWTANEGISGGGSWLGSSAAIISGYYLFPYSAHEISYHYSGQSFDNDQCAKTQFTYNASNSTGGEEYRIGVMLRGAASAATYYAVELFQNNSTVGLRIMKVTTGTRVNTGASCTTPAAEDKVTIDVAGSSPAVITAYDDTTATTLCTFSDISSPFTSGSVGVEGWGDYPIAEIGVRQMRVGNWNDATTGWIPWICNWSVTGETISGYTLNFTTDEIDEPANPEGNGNVPATGTQSGSTCTDPQVAGYRVGWTTTPYPDPEDIASNVTSSDFDTGGTASSHTFTFTNISKYGGEYVTASRASVGVVVDVAVEGFTSGVMDHSKYLTSQETVQLQSSNPPCNALPYWGGNCNQFQLPAPSSGDTKDASINAYGSSTVITGIPTQIYTACNYLSGQIDECSDGNIGSYTHLVSAGIYCVAIYNSSAGAPNAAITTWPGSAATIFGSGKVDWTNAENNLAAGNIYTQTNSGDCVDRYEEFPVERLRILVPAGTTPGLYFAKITAYTGTWTADSNPASWTAATSTFASMTPVYFPLHVIANALPAIVPPCPGSSECGTGLDTTQLSTYETYLNSWFESCADYSITNINYCRFVLSNDPATEYGGHTSSSDVGVSSGHDNANINYYDGVELGKNAYAYCLVHPASFATNIAGTDSTFAGGCPRFIAFTNWLVPNEQYSIDNFGTQDYLNQWAGPLWDWQVNGATSIYGENGQTALLHGWNGIIFGHLPGDGRWDGFRLGFCYATRNAGLSVCSDAQLTAILYDNFEHLLGTVAPVGYAVGTANGTQPLTLVPLADNISPGYPQDFYYGQSKKALIACFNDPIHCRPTVAGDTLPHQIAEVVRQFTNAEIDHWYYENGTVGYLMTYNYNTWNPSGTGLVRTLASARAYDTGRVFGLWPRASWLWSLFGDGPTVSNSYHSNWTYRQWAERLFDNPKAFSNFDSSSPHISGYLTNGGKTVEEAYTAFFYTLGDLGYQIAPPTANIFQFGGHSRPGGGSKRGFLNLDLLINVPRQKTFGMSFLPKPENDDQSAIGR